VLVDLSIGAQAVTYADGIIKDKIIVDFGFFRETFMAVDSDPYMFVAINPGTADAVYAEEESKIKVRNNSILNNRQCGIFISSLHKNGLVTQGNIIKNNVTDTSSSRSGGAVVGYPQESLSGIFLNNNEIKGNNGKNIQQFKAIASSFGEIGNSDNQRPRF
ncbi:Right handed beta helix region, partial [Candidatus Electrothrix communis]